MYDQSADIVARVSTRTQQRSQVVRLMLVAAFACYLAMPSCWAQADHTYRFAGTLPVPRQPWYVAANGGTASIGRDNNLRVCSQDGKSMQIISSNGMVLRTHTNLVPTYLTVCAGADSDGSEYRMFYLDATPGSGVAYLAEKLDADGNFVTGFTPSGPSYALAGAAVLSSKRFAYQTSGSDTGGFGQGQVFVFDSSSGAQVSTFTPSDKFGIVQSDRTLTSQVDSAGHLLFISASGIYKADSFGHELRRVEPLPGTGACSDYSQWAIFGLDSRVYVNCVASDGASFYVFVLSNDLSPIKTLHFPNIELGSIAGVSATGDIFYMSFAGVERIDGATGALSSFSPLLPFDNFVFEQIDPPFQLNQLLSFHGVAVAPRHNGNVIIGGPSPASTGYTLVEYRPDGAPIAEIAFPFAISSIADIAEGADGYLYADVLVSDASNCLGATECIIATQIANAPPACAPSSCTTQPPYVTNWKYVTTSCCGVSLTMGFLNTSVYASDGTTVRTLSGGKLTGSIPLPAGSRGMIGSGQVSNTFALEAAPSLLDFYLNNFSAAGALNGQTDVHVSDPALINSCYNGSTYVPCLGIGNGFNVAPNGDFAFTFFAVKQAHPAVIFDHNIVNNVYNYALPPDPGFLLGQTDAVGTIKFGPGGDLYVTEQQLYRVSRFVSTPPSVHRKIVAVGGRASASDALWPGVEAALSRVADTLVATGQAKSDVEILSPDLADDIYLDGSKPVVAAPSMLAISIAITGTFASDAQELVVYLVGHGGPNGLRLNDTEILDAAQLKGWLDTWQAAHAGKRAIVIVDACQIGGFIQGLANPAYPRVVITSTTTTQNANFVDSGGISFSGVFVDDSLHGGSLADAFTGATAVLNSTFGSTQTPQIDANGNGIPNEQADFNAVQGTYLALDTQDLFAPAPAPSIGTVTATTPSGGTQSTTITATNVQSSVGIARVWALIQPPGFSSAAGGGTRTPQIELSADPAHPGNYIGVYPGLNSGGSYTITVYAQDVSRQTSMPVNQSVQGASPTSSKAMIAVLSGGSGYAAAGESAYAALRQQGYVQAANNPNCTGVLCDDILYLGSGVHADLPPTLENLTDGVGVIGANTQDLLIYLTGLSSGSGIAVAGDSNGSGSGTLSEATVAAWLTTLESQIAGRIVVVVDKSNASAFLSLGTATSDHPRVVITSTGANQNAFVSSNGNISFSTAFWSNVFSGANTKTAFDYATGIVSFQSGGLQQTPQLTDNLNAVGDEFCTLPTQLNCDGVLSSNTYIGGAVATAADQPAIPAGAVTTPAALNGQNTITINVANVISALTVTSMHAIVFYPNGTEATELDLAPSGSSYSGTAYGVDKYAGTYQVVVFARNSEAQLSLPATMSFVQNMASDIVFKSGFE